MDISIKRKVFLAVLVLLAVMAAYAPSVIDRFNINIKLYSVEISSSLLLIFFTVAAFIVSKFRKKFFFLLLMLPLCFWQLILTLYSIICWNTGGFAP